MVGPFEERQPSRQATPASRWALAAAALPFIALVPTLHWVPLPPATAAPISWPAATANAALLLGLLWAHTWCYARWQPHASRRMSVNEALARTWFGVYGGVIVGLATPNGLRFLPVALSWAALTWEVHRKDVAKRGYDQPAALANWGLFLLGLAFLELLAVRLS